MNEQQTEPIISQSSARNMLALLRELKFRLMDAESWDSLMMFEMLDAIDEAIEQADPKATPGSLWRIDSGHKEAEPAIDRAKQLRSKGWAASAKKIAGEWLVKVRIKKAEEVAADDAAREDS